MSVFLRGLDHLESLVSDKLFGSRVLKSKFGTDMHIDSCHIKTVADNQLGPTYFLARLHNLRGQEVNFDQGAVQAA